MLNPYGTIRPLMRLIRPAAVALVLVLVFSSCAGSYSYYVTGNETQRRELSSLFGYLDTERDGKRRFIVIQQIYANLSALEQWNKLQVFLSSWVEKNPDDPYDAYYLYLVANIYETQGAPDFAAYYYARIYRNYPDLMTGGSSLHLRCLNRLIVLIDNSLLKADYYKELIARFRDQVDIAVCYFQLGRTYEELGEWDLAIQTYEKFLPLAETTTRVSGFSNPYKYAKKLVDFHHSTKDWAQDDLAVLVARIETGLSQNSGAILRANTAKVDFFAKSWEQEETESPNRASFSFESFFSYDKGIQFADALDSSSNSREAFLKTWGWSSPTSISVWYLYFRKINFPADPEIHGRWEWAGIYFGEKH
jgi:hypothetical protein